jgi:hypothetical protein
MKFRVAFLERTDSEGNKTENPPDYVDLDLPDGVVLDSAFVERTEPEALHVQEVMDEDDAFESMAAEVWEYDIADGREQDFIDALKNSKMVIEYEPLDDVDMIDQGGTGAP